jgi:hypothetical protein
MNSYVLDAQYPCERRRDVKRPWAAEEAEARGCGRTPAQRHRHAAERQRSGIGICAGDGLIHFQEIGLFKLRALRAALADDGAVCGDEPA